MDGQKTLEGLYKLQQMLGENTKKTGENTKRIEKISMDMEEGFKQVNERLDIVESTMRVLNEDTLKTQKSIT